MNSAVKNILYFEGVMGQKVDLRKTAPFFPGIKMVVPYAKKKNTVKKLLIKSLLVVYGERIDSHGI